MGLHPRWVNGTWTEFHWVSRSERRDISEAVRETVEPMLADIRRPELNIRSLAEGPALRARTVHIGPYRTLHQPRFKTVLTLRFEPRFVLIALDEASWVKGTQQGVCAPSAPSSGTDASLDAPAHRP